MACNCTNSILSNCSDQDLLELAGIISSLGCGPLGTNLTYMPEPTGGTMSSSTGTPAFIPLVNETNAGLISPELLAMLLNAGSLAHPAVTVSAPGNGLSIDVATQVLNMALASSTSTGALSSTDWNIFNNKQDALGYIPENVANKQNSMNLDGTGIKYPTVDAVNIQANNVSRATMNIGLIDVTSDAFDMFRVNDTTLGITGTSVGVIFPNYFDVPPFVPSDAVRQIPTQNYPLQNFLSYLPTAGTQGVFYIGWRDSTQTIELSTTSMIQNPNIFQMGIIYLKNVGGTISFIDANRTVLTMPDVSQYSNLETTAIGVSTGMSIAPNNNLTIRNIASSIIGISVNYKGANNDERPIAAADPTTFTRISPADSNAVVLPPPTTIVQTDNYYNPVTKLMTALGPAIHATVQRWLVTVRGTFILQPGEEFFTSFEAAKNAIYTVNFTDFLPKGTFVEIARMAAIKTAANLANPNDAVFFATGKGGGGSSAPATVTFNQIQGFPEDNANLNASLDAKVDVAGDIMTGPLTAPSLIKTGGTSTQFLKADGSVDNNTYLTITSLGQTLREEFVFASNQTFTVSTPYTQVQSVEVQGQGSLSSSQYTLLPPNQVQINDVLDPSDYIVIIYSTGPVGSSPFYTQAQVDALLANKEDKGAPAQVTVTTSVNITTDTLADGGYSMIGRHVLIKNGATPINITLNGVGLKPTSFQKEGTGTITFVAGSGRTLRQVDGTAIFNGAVGSTATVTSDGTLDSLRLSNA